MKDYIVYWLKMIAFAFRGGGRFYSWFSFLLVICIGGAAAYYFQLRNGLVVTNLTDQVSWGAYIANFNFLVGVAAAAVLLVVPTYVYGRKDVKEVVILGELLGMSAIIMCLLFIIVDLGRPDRFLHILPFIGRLNFPRSILAWDVIVLNVYLLLNLHIPGYLLYKKYRGETPTSAYYKPLVFTSIIWAISIHTVTAFLYSGLGGRPFWNSAILAPRFLVSAFAAGPALMILAFTFIKRYTTMDVKDSVIDLLKNIIKVTLPLNLFLVFCEVFKEFYTNTVHTVSAQYLYFGLHGHSMLSPYIWSSLIFSLFAMVVFLVPRFRANMNLVLVACVLMFIGIWIEKGMGLIIPGFIPTPLGDLVEYTPALVEFFVSLGIWAAGALIFTLSTRVAIGIQTGKLRLGE